VVTGTIAALQKTAADLLVKKTVDLVIGYGQSPLGDIVPLFIRKAEEAERLQWNRHCTYNLVRYLTDREVIGPAGVGPEDRKADAQSKDTAAGKVAVVVKGCDLKSLVVLQSESQVRRDRLTVIGLPCPGVTDKGGRLLAKCESCPPELYNPREGLCDLVVGAPVDETGGRPVRDGSFQEIEEIDALEATERRELWDRYFSRCLRCYACRNVCPLCYCKECVFDQHDPRWVSPAAGVATNRAFHLIRAYHLAGRCVDCGECERACPVGIPLRRINRKVAKVVEESFHFQAGLDPEAKSPLVLFSSEDPEEFIE